uniref:NAD-dependent epimerase/dehydratase domain-containing protein n=1 Tax=Glossina austeni TaxID=7395 RepID=A0A1A9UK52_GLOAU
MCTDEEFHEINSNFITGSIQHQRWIYSSSKQLPFNWIGSRLDDFKIAQMNHARVITQMIFNIAHGLPITLVNNGKQKRCFTDICDGIEALFNIIEDKKNNCNQQIINIGNPKNEYSILELAKIILHNFQKITLKNSFPKFSGFQNLSGDKYYGVGYQDVEYRKPNIGIAQKLLNWMPKIQIHNTINHMLKFFLKL